MNNDDVRFLLALVPEWARKSTPGLDPTFYGTGQYEADKTIVDKVKEIEARLYAEDKAEEETEEFKETKTVVPKWFYKLVFVVCSKVASWAMKKAGIKPDQHKRAEEGTERIKNASDKIKDTPVNVEERNPDDLFNNTTFNS